MELGRTVSSAEGGGGVADFDRICAVLCLMTDAAHEEGMPQPVSRAAMHRLLSSGTLDGLALRDRGRIERVLLDRCEQLLSRTAAVYACFERYLEQGFDVILPQDARWPKRLLALGERMPQFLFIHGNASLLERRTVAVAGSREIAPGVARAAYDLGAQIAKEGFLLVSGCARGVDSSAERGALDAGGSALLVPAVPFNRCLTDKRKAQLEEGRLLMFFDALPDDPFSVPRAIARNHTIYALGEAAVAVAARSGVGGTWRGACDCLSIGCTPVFVPAQEVCAGSGDKELINRGAKKIDLHAPLGAQMFALQQTSLLI